MPLRDTSSKLAAHVAAYHLLTAAPINHIGTPGGPGFGVGICPPASLPAGFTGMTGYDSPVHDNYGNYQYLDGSVMCWIPAFFYQFTTDTNDFRILPRSAYPNVETANAAGWALHRAFYDGGVEQPGFFVDKYQLSANTYLGNTIASSIKNGNPLSSNSAHNGWGSLLTDLTTADNIYAGAIKAAKTRGANFHCASRFQYAALALLAMAHGQAASSSLCCAWYDAGKTTNFPKGNNNALSDVNDTTVKWQSDGYSNCGKTGSAGYGGGAGNVFAKSTHNGQSCGVADLNGNLWEVSIGLTCIATSKTITAATQANPVAITAVAHGFSTGDVVQIQSVVGMTQINDKLFKITVTGVDTFTLDGCDGSAFTTYTSGGTATKGAFHAAKTATAMKAFTSGATLATDHWGATGVAALMQPINAGNCFRTDYSQNVWDKRYGRGANQVLDNSLTGAGWVLTGLGLPKAAGISDSTTGSSLFGADYYYQYVRDQLCPLAGGYWSTTTYAGVWAVALDAHRTNSFGTVGGRAGLYVQ